MSILSAPGTAKALPEKVLPDSVTTYDILKSLAVIIMIIDHIGYYFFPDQEAWRAVGRLCVPVWLFLIGYARSRRIDYMLIGGALVLVAADIALARNFFALNILVTITLLRLTVDPLMRLIKGDTLVLMSVTVVLYLLFPLTNLFVEYGTMALMFAVCGHMARNGFAGDANIPRLYGVICLAAYVATQHAVFDFTPALDAFNAVGSALMLAALFFYLPRRDAIGFRITSPLARKTLRLLGSRTLEIYVIHLLLFKIAHAFLCGCIKCSCHLGFQPLSLLA